MRRWLGAVALLAVSMALAASCTGPGLEPPGRESADDGTVIGEPTGGDMVGTGTGTSTTGDPGNQTTEGDGVVPEDDAGVEDAGGQP